MDADASLSSPTPIATATYIPTTTQLAGHEYPVGTSQKKINGDFEKVVSDVGSRSHDKSGDHHKAAYLVTMALLRKTDTVTLLLIIHQLITPV